MKFTIVDKYEYQWPVDIHLPDPKRPGKTVKQSFIGTFRMLSRDEQLEIQREYRELKTDAERAEHEHDLLKRVFVGWNEDVVDDGGHEVPFDDGTFSQALQMSWFRIGLYRAYAKSTAGEEARKGN